MERMEEMVWVTIKRDCLDGYSRSLLRKSFMNPTCGRASYGGGVRKRLEASATDSIIDEGIKVNAKRARGTGP